VINENLNTDISKKDIKGNRNNDRKSSALDFENSKNVKNFLKISTDDPLKFQKLMKKEQELWDLAEIKNKAILNVWNELNGCDNENIIYKTFQDMKDDLSSGVPVEYILGDFIPTYVCVTVFLFYYTFINIHMSIFMIKFTYGSAFVYTCIHADEIYIFKI
jgi:hypothetical protein